MNPWDIFKDGIFWLISAVYSFTADWGLAIIIITVIFRLLLIPIMHKQSKASYQMKKFNPQMTRIKELYANDKTKQTEEMQKLYAEAKFNPISSCIPMFIQMPIFIALFQVLREMEGRVEGTDYCFYNIIPNLVIGPNDAWASVFGEQGTGDLLSFLPYLILLIIFAGATFLPMILQQQVGDADQRKKTLMMSGVMSIVMLFVGWGSPAGVLLFWGTSSVLALVQQRISMKILQAKDKQEEEEKQFEPVQVDVVRKEKNKRPRKKK